MPPSISKYLLIVEQEDCLICVDEAYADFCDFTALDLFQKHENLVICRTFSKWLLHFHDNAIFLVVKW